MDTVSGGVVQFGGAVFVSPKSATKSFNGSGVSNTGVNIVTVNGASSTNTVDTDVLDQPIVQDN
ncbi:spore germination protein [Neobacillus sp. PS2-9]|uniref:spore germination protein n=1 Tax=Neobacillus sp. PS2-9 TaxID=3070676 RepID=UPI0027E16562|nr:spore germination protein [Neobacillus sp. PS2-9]WML60658.1 spore germination protein [Neobacillus sp. PS2-9]